MVVQLPLDLVNEILSFVPKDNTMKSPVSDLLKPYIVRYNNDEQINKTMDYYTWLQKVDKDIIKEYYYKEYIGIVEKNHKVVEYNWINGITGRTHSKVIYDMQRFNELMLSPDAPDIVNRVWVMV